MKAEYLVYGAVLLLSTVVMSTHCCSSRRLPPQRPPHMIPRPTIVASQTSSRPSAATTESTSTIGSDGPSALPAGRLDDRTTGGHLTGHTKSTAVLPSATTSTAVAPAATTITTSSARTRVDKSDSNCTDKFRDFYCLNNGVCFNYTIQQNFSLISCLCADGFMGERCEDKYLQGTYTTKARSGRSMMLHIASVQFGAFAAFAIVITVFYAKMHITKRLNSTPSACSTTTTSSSSLPYTPMTN